MNAPFIALISFGLIWLGLILFAADSYRVARRGQAGVAVNS